MNQCNHAPDTRRQRPARGVSGQRIHHDSAEKHVTGQAAYTDDIPELANTLFAAVGQSQEAHALISTMDLSPVRAAAGVVAVVTLDDIPGEQDIGPVFPGDPLFADGTVEYVGQPLFAVAATSVEAARKATRLARVDYAPLPAVLTIPQAIAQEHFVRPSHSLSMGDAEQAIASAPHQLSGELYLKGQEHVYLEGQISYAIPTEDRGMRMTLSSQHPGEIQHTVARLLDIPFNQVEVEVRRIGGGFGGKETQSAAWACMAALLAHKLQRPVKLRLPRRDDMVMTGKRHDFLSRYRVGFDDQGRVLGCQFWLAGKCGYSPDLSDAVIDRAMFQVENAYCLNAVHVTGLRCKTHTVSNTAFRGFGAPQGTAIVEYMLDDIARKLRRDPLDIRQINLFKDGDQTHYGQTVEHILLPALIRELETTSDYRARREAISQFNSTHHYRKRGLALTPVKFGVSFTIQFLNQAGALVHLFTDGSIHLNHGGIEMGQGLMTKVAQVVATEFQVDLDRIQISAANTHKVPNASATAASSGADLNGKAAQDACQTLKHRLVEFAAKHYEADSDSIRFVSNHVQLHKDNREVWIPFETLVKEAYLNRVSLSATGFYQTPKIHYDREKGRGRPFFYFAQGAACSEVEIDTLTGEYTVLRTDILHDVGTSLNPAIDIGQIEGGFIQGMGWVTTEELSWDDKGHILSDNLATYKIPTATDIPKIFNIKLYDQPNGEETIYHSKAVGEPPLLLALSVWLALRDAVASIANYRINPPLNIPATPERVLDAVLYLQQWTDRHDG
ncbi:xanthine dehydrogenase molybdopterin binding subunit [Kistimonas scapharcae]|uniref:Xanthine dehydrogenase molybdopterin binding subunit n=1 Tax=Kistimonas scapharcae TaxID=1036133 RepID=A0ABP8V4I4_9GAMM